MLEGAPHGMPRHAHLGAPFHPIAHPIYGCAIGWNSEPTRLRARNAQRIRGLCVNGIYAVNALRVYARKTSRGMRDGPICSCKE